MIETTFWDDGAKMTIVRDVDKAGQPIDDRPRLIRIADVRGDGRRAPDVVQAPVEKRKLDRLVENADEVIAAMAKGVEAVRVVAMRGARSLQ